MFYKAKVFNTAFSRPYLIQLDSEEALMNIKSGDHLTFDDNSGIVIMNPTDFRFTVREKLNV